MIILQKINRYAKYFIPYGFIILRKRCLQKMESRHEKLKSEIRLQKEHEIKNYFLSLNIDEVDPEIQEIINYFKSDEFSVFPYEFTKKYYTSDIKVFFDKTTETLFVMHENKRLYFPEGWDVNRVRLYYNSLRIEQDKDSPHRYEIDGFVVQPGDVIADVGAAEGIWALNYAGKAGKIYLFEYDPEWIKALQKTFEPWKNDVIIVNKYVSNRNDNKNITLDSFFDEKRIDFIKADIEGMEMKLIEGSQNILANNNLKLLLCAYHSKNVDVKMKEILEKNGYETQYSKRYMLFVYGIYEAYGGELGEPYIRRGVLRAQKIT